jgi:hypothetical protein
VSSTDPRGDETGYVSRGAGTEVVPTARCQFFSSSWLMADG